MKFMLILNSPRDGYAQYMKWPKAVLQANGEFMQAFSQRLKASGELAGAAGLADPVRARRVRMGTDGRPVTDGVFPEAKEFLAGYWIVDVQDEARALEIAAEASTAPGGTVLGADGKEEEHLWVEVRQVMGGRADLIE